MAGDGDLTDDRRKARDAATQAFLFRFIQKKRPAKAASLCASDGAAYFFLPSAPKLAR